MYVSVKLYNNHIKRFFFNTARVDPGFVLPGEGGRGGGGGKWCNAAPALKKVGGGGGLTISF